MKMEDLAAVGKRVKLVRKTLKIQQKELSAELGISNSHLSEIEKGESNPTASFFLKLSQKYDVSVEYLFHGRGNMFYSDKDQTKTKEIRVEGDIDSIEKLVWLMEKSYYFRNSVLGLASRFKLENDNFIKMSIEQNISQIENQESSEQ